MSTHIMIDLETLGHTPDSKILSLGAVMFDNNGSFLRTLSKHVTLDSQPTRTISDSTFRWWLDQGEFARKSMANAGPLVALGSALSSLRALISECDEKIKVWSCGASFDIPMLEHAYAQAGLTPPWRFWNHRCYRTVKELYKDVPKPERTGTHHDALDDAKYQAQHLISIHRAVGGIL